MLNVRLAEPVDLASVIKFDAFPGDRVIEIIDHRMLVIDVDGETQGYASWQKNGCIGMDYVNKLVVSDAYRRRGLAKYLIGGLSTVLHGRIFISASSSNTAAIRLLHGTMWTRAGEIIGLLPSDEAEVFFYKDLPE